jgi:hypothetical protein
MVNRCCQQVVRARGRQSAAGGEGAGAWLFATVVARARFATVVVRVRFDINIGRNKCQRRGDGIDGDDGELSEGLVVEQVGCRQPQEVDESSAPGSSAACLTCARVGSAPLVSHVAMRPTSHAACRPSLLLGRRHRLLDHKQDSSPHHITHGSAASTRSAALLAMTMVATSSLSCRHQTPTTMASRASLLNLQSMLVP